SLPPATPNRIRGFARRWGVLGICEEHGLPSAHNAGPASPALRRAVPGFAACEPHQITPPDGVPGPVYVEPVAAWQLLIKQIRAILALAFDLRRGDDGQEADWRVVLKLLGVTKASFGRRLATQGREARWHLLVNAANYFLELAGARPEVRRVPTSADGDGMEIAIGQRSLIGALAVQLAMVVADRDGLALCSGCGCFYDREDRPRRGQENFCERCRDEGESSKRAQRRHRERNDRRRTIYNNPDNNGRVPG
ncbi:MAG TPA: hypothetical protein VFD32_23450, partial [Dehalococcoidia bacterium]|nr:hypothetical protein [Dehalococcoidia bacterium]